MSCTGLELEIQEALCKYVVAEGRHPEVIQISLESLRILSREVKDPNILSKGLFGIKTRLMSCKDDAKCRYIFVKYHVYK